MLEILSLCLSKNLNKVFSLKIQNHPDKILNYLMKEIQLFSPQKYDSALENLSEQDYMNWYHNLFNMSFLANILSEDLSEIIIHSPQDSQFYQLNGHLKNTEISLSSFDFNLALEILSIKMEKQFCYEVPFVSFQCQLLQLKCRVSLVHSSISTRSCHSLYCRVAHKNFFPIESFCLNPSVNTFINNICQKKWNIVVAGATSSGKTSLVKSILTNFPDEEHTVLIEDTLELDVKSKNYSHLLARDGKPQDIENYCSNLLRMRPDRIILGEIRSSEVVPLLLNLNCGHKGLLTTIHANSAVDTVDRIATLFMIYGKSLNIAYDQVLSLICKNIDFIIYMEKAKIKEIIQVHNSINSKIHFDKIY